MSEDQRFEWEGLGMKVKAPTKKMTEVIAALLSVAAIVGGLGLWVHRVEANDNTRKVEQAVLDSNKNTVKAIEKLGARQEALLRAILSESREQTCLQRFSDPAERQKQEQFCRNIGRQIGNGNGNGGIP